LRILFDTNVVLDVLLNRQPHAMTAAQLMAYVEQGRIQGLVAATTVTTIHYLATKSGGSEAAAAHVEALLSLFDVAAVDRTVLSDALSLSFADYEDAVVHEAARHAGAMGIVTRDREGFGKATLRIYAPHELLKMLQALNADG
jgi:predicted nucleic acid-binding protein